jgi:hypothetical protein
MSAPYRIPSTSPDYNAQAAGAVDNFDRAFSTETETAGGAIGIKEGTVFLNSGSVLAMTLAVPTAGAQSAGGDDGRELWVVAIQSAAHTVTSPLHGINTNKNIATFAAAIGNSILLVAFNGAWYMMAQAGITLSGS